MTYKQWMRRLFSDLWWRCADLGKEQLRKCSYHDTNHAKWWEDFIDRCDKRSVKHAEFVPGKDHGQHGGEVHNVRLDRAPE